MKDGLFEEIVLTEEQAASILNPIFVIDNGIKGAVNMNKIRGSQPIHHTDISERNLKTMSSPWYLDNFKIEYAYESSGDSEYTILSIRWEDGDYYENMKDSYNSYISWREIASVDPSDIGSHINGSLIHFTDNDELSAIFFQTYERDWIRSKKYLGTCPYGSQFDFYGSVTLTSDWYAYDRLDDMPSTALSQYGGTPWYYFNDGKGYQTFWGI